MFKNKPKIEFVCTVDGLADIPEVRPRPAKHFMPEWFKHVPPGSTVRSCPAFPDFFSNGFVVPMWTDSKLYYDSDNGSWNSKSTPLLKGWDIHQNVQFLDYTDYGLMNDKAVAVFKASSPWQVFVSRGYSILQVPMFYHFNSEWSALPGVFDADIMHESNVQIATYVDKKEIFIPRGTPLVMYVPFKRTKFDLDIRYPNKKDYTEINKGILYLQTKFNETGAYRKMQRDRDQEII